MADALTIDFSITGADKITAFFGKLSSLSGQADRNLQGVKGSADAATHSYKALNAEVEKYNRLTGTRGQSAPVNIGRGQPLAAAGSPSATSLKSGRYVSGPFQMQPKLAAQMDRAQADKDWRAQADIGLRQKSNEKAIARATAAPKGFGDKLMDVLKTSRFGVGKGGGAELMPLVGKTVGLAAEALGPEVMALAGPVGIVAGLLVGAATGLKSLADSAAATGATFRQQSVTLGSSAETAGAIANVGGFDAAGQAEQYNRAISNGGTGQLAGMREGAQNINNPLFDKFDRGAEYWRAMEIRRTLPAEQQERDARATGTEASMPLMGLSDEQFKRTETEGRQEGRSVGDSGLDSVRYQQSMSAAAHSADVLTAALGRPWMKMFGGFEDAVTRGNLATLKWVDGINRALGLVGPDKPASADAGGKSADMNKNTDALNRLTDAIPGQYGSDPQGRRAAALSEAAGFHASSTNRDYYVRGAMALGAFA